MLGVTTLLSLFVIPEITERSSRKKLVQETRVQKSLEIIHHVTFDSARLNQIRTLFHIFEKEARALADAAELASCRARLKSAADDIYLSFDSDAWWWHQEILHQTAILDLLSAERRTEFSKLTQRYSDNLITTKNLFDEAREKHIAGKGESEPAKVPSLMPPIEKAFYALHNERVEIMVQMVRLLQ